MRTNIITAIDKAVTDGARFFKACDAINICPRRIRRWRVQKVDGRVGGYRATSQRLSDMEKKAIVYHFTSKELLDLPVRVAHAILMDKGVYIASPASCIRVLNELNSRNSKPNVHTNRVRPELKATGPDQVWCWDITWLPSNVRGKYFYLYLIIDMYSRLIIDWEIHTTEDGVFARQLFARSFELHKIDETSTLIVHSDNGQTMRSRTLNELYNDLSVRASHSRPHTSNDNAYAESIFATYKGRVLYPDKFMTIEGAEVFTEEFVIWYNYQHKHSELDYLSPFQVHNFEHKNLLKNRNTLLNKNRELHSSRHGGKNKKYQIPTIVKLKHRVTLKTAENILN